MPRQDRLGEWAPPLVPRPEAAAEGTAAARATSALPMASSPRARWLTLSRRLPITWHSESCWEVALVTARTAPTGP